MLSMFREDSPFTVYNNEYWKSDKWDPLEYGKEYDFSKSFFEQFKKLFQKTPHPNLIQKNLINSEYANYTLNTKNCYFVASTDTAEDCMYSFGAVLGARECLDVHQSHKVELCYEILDCTNSSKLRFSEACTNCTDSWLLYDCINCSDCVGCVGLRNKSHYIFNEKLSKEEYKKRLSKLRLGTFSGVQNAQQTFKKLKTKTPRKFAAILKSENVLGDDITNSRNLYWCFNARNDIENCRYGFRLHQGVKDGADAFIVWNGAELFYEAVSVTAQNVKYSAFIWGGFDVQYSYNCFDSNHIFGCVGLRSKEYCIFNKQYSKEEYEELVPKIIKQMKEKTYTDKKGRVYSYGEFFPTDLSPFAYNETLAQDYYPKTKEAAKSFGCAWQEPETKKYTITLPIDSITDDIEDAKDSITEQIIGCAHGGTCTEPCATAFKILPQELTFYRRLGVPLPRLCPQCRHMERVRLKNPINLWHRKCQCAGEKSENEVYQNTSTHSHHGVDHCPKEFETAYSPDRKEIIYCEKCYQAETS